MPQGDRTLHIFTHHIQKTENELRDIMGDYMLENIDWVRKISKKFLNEVETSVEDYIDAITSVGTPLDFFGITVLCRIYHFHVGVFLKNGFWSTAHKLREQNLRFTLVFHSNFIFTETVRNGKEDSYNEWIAHRQSLGKMRSHVKTEGSNLEELYDSRNDESQNEEEEHEEEKEVKSEIVVPNYNAFKMGADEHSSAIEEDNSCEPHEDDGVKENSLEPNEVQPTENSSEQNEINGTENSASNNISFALAQAAFVQYCASDAPTSSTGKIVACPVQYCTFTESTQLAVNTHITSDHPDYRFPCRSCTKTFVFANSRYKHEKEHEKPALYCGECGKGFHFNSELQRHLGIHEEVLPFPCEQCERRFAAKKTLTRHLQEHSDKIYQCEMCDKVCPSNDKLYTHFRGAHGKGYTAPCGEWTQWPGKRARHQAKCDRCKELIKIQNLRKRPVQFKKEADVKKIKLESVKKENIVKQETDRKNIKLEKQVKTETDLKNITTENGIKKECKVELTRLKIIKK